MSFSKTDHKNALSYGLVYVPGLIVLIFSMAALHFSVSMLNSRNALHERLNVQSAEILSLSAAFDEFELRIYNYVSNPDQGTPESLKDAYSEFVSAYNVLLDNRDASIDTSSINYYKNFSEIDRYILPISTEIKKLEEGNVKPLAYYEQKLEPIAKDIDDLATDFIRNAANLQDLAKDEFQEQMVYWSVLVLGFTGFLLALLNASKLSKLKNAGAEKQKNLELLKQRLEALESAFDGIGIVDSDGNLIYMNSALLNLHGLTKDDEKEFLGQSWGNLYTEKGQELIERVVMPAVKAEGGWKGESPIVRKDGSIITAELQLRPMPSGGYIGTARDITLQKKSDQEKEQLQQQFYQAQKMEAVGRLAGGIAHDFNNILAAMNGYAEFLIDDLDKESAQHGFARNILTAGKQARALIDQILAFSRRQNSGADMIALDVISCVKENIAMLNASLPKTIELKEEFQIDQALIKANDTQLSQLVMNLCVNALDAMQEERGTLKITVSKTDEIFDLMFPTSENLPDLKGVPSVKIEDGKAGQTHLYLNTLSTNHEYISLKIEDTGTGMSRSIMEHLFEPFFTTKPVDRGTGLGLSMVHGVIVNHQGAMRIDSTVGKGTSFELLFPVFDGERSHENQISEISTDLRGLKILVVEDQEEVGKVTVEMLERSGADAFECHSGIEALKVLRENQGTFDLVLTDQNMPKMTGLELVYQVSEDQPDLPFVILSGYSPEKLQELIDQHPAIKAALKKPIERAELAMTIKNVVSGVKKSSAAA